MTEHDERRVVDLDTDDDLEVIHLPLVEGVLDAPFLAYVPNLMLSSAISLPSVGVSIGLVRPGHWDALTQSVAERNRLAHEPPQGPERASSGSSEAIRLLWGVKGLGVKEPGHVADAPGVETEVKQPPRPARRPVRSSEMRRKLREARDELRRDLAAPATTDAPRKRIRL